MKRHLFILIILSVLLSGNTCSAQANDSATIINSLNKCWRAISHEYSTIYGLEEEEIKNYLKQKVCFTTDSISMYYGVSFAPRYSIRKVNADEYAKDNFDCNKHKLGISLDSVFEITISSITKAVKKEPEHKMTNVIAYDGYCIYAVVDGVIFKLFDADAKVQERSTN